MGVAFGAVQLGRAAR